MSIYDDPSEEETDWFKPTHKYPWGVGMGNPMFENPYQPDPHDPSEIPIYQPRRGVGSVPPAVAGVEPGALGQASPGVEQGFDQQYQAVRDQRRALLERRKLALQNASRSLDEETKGQINLPLLAFGMSLLKPTRSGSFFESVGNAGEAAVGALGAQRKDERERRLKKMGLELQGDELEDKFLADNEKFLQTKDLVRERYGRMAELKRTPTAGQATGGNKPMTEAQLNQAVEQVYKSMYGDYNVPPDKQIELRQWIRGQIINRYGPAVDPSGGGSPAAAPPAGGPAQPPPQNAPPGGDVISGTPEGDAVGGGGASVPGGPPVTPGDQGGPGGQYAARPHRQETRKMIPTPAQRELFGLPDKEAMITIQYDRQGRVIRMVHAGDVPSKEGPAQVPLEERNKEAQGLGLPTMRFDPYRSYTDPKVRGDIQKRDQASLPAFLKEYDDAIDQVPKAIANVDRFLELNKKVDTGWLAGQQGRVGYFGSDAQEMEKIALGMSREHRIPGEGTISNFDAQMFQRMTVGMGTSREANRNVAEMYKAAKKMQYDKAQYMRAYAEYWGHVRGAQENWDRYINSPYGKILVKDSKGNPRVNQNLMNWRQFFSQGDGQPRDQAPVVVDPSMLRGR